MRPPVAGDTPKDRPGSKIVSIELESGTGVLPTQPAPDHLNLSKPDKEADPMVPTDSDTRRTERLQKICLEHLALCRNEAENVARNRVHYVKLARLYGLTNQRIGDALGITEAAVRSMVSRSE